MAFDNRVFDDLARMASGAMGTVLGAREELEAQLRQRVELALQRMDVVPREEFEVVREMARTARARQEDLETTVATLEARIAALEKTGGAAKPAATKAPAAKRSPGTAKRAPAKKAPAATSGSRSRKAPPSAS